MIWENGIETCIISYMKQNCLFLILTPVLSSRWPWMNYLTSLHFCLFVCKTRTLTFLIRWSWVLCQHLDQFLAQSGLQMGLNSPCVQKLLHCFSIKINRIPLGLILFQKLEELVESLCLTWDRQSAAHGDTRLPIQCLVTLPPPPPTTMTSLFWQNIVGTKGKV